MLQRKTQTAAFWRDQFEVTTTDIDFLYNLLLDAQAPRSTGDLATALIDNYLRKENSKIKEELGKGEVYAPNGDYAPGTKLVFPALEFAVGEVQETRSGQNPEHGEFNVMQVQFESGVREFAAGLQSPHRLNQNNGDLLADDSLLSAQEIYSLYGGEIDESLLFALEEGERSRDFAQVDGTWMLADMLADVNVGHLNIAEALIEVEGEPVALATLLKQVDMPGGMSQTMKEISLRHALKRDGRFDRVVEGDQSKWFLKRLEPESVGDIPLVLRHRGVQYNRALLSVELLQVEWELDDEWGESSLSSEVPSIVPSTSFSLTYPHRQAGTIPLTGRTRSFFPVEEGAKAQVTLVDGRWGTRFTGWVVPEGRYVAGLGQWMADHEIPVGAQLTLERVPENPAEVVVDFRSRRARREWARIGEPDVENLRLQFKLDKINIACEYDELLVVAEENPQQMEALRRAIPRNKIRLDQIIEQIVPELAQLDPQGTVHAKSVYSAINMVRRTPPGPIFYALISNRQFRDVGGGMFSLV